MSNYHQLRQRAFEAEGGRRQKGTYDILVWLTIVSHFGYVDASANTGTIFCFAYELY